MQNTIRILPDTAFARLVAAATGVELTIVADPLGRWATATIALSEGTDTKLQIGAAPGPVGTAPHLRPYAPGVYGTLDDLTQRRRELDALHRFGDLVVLACRGQLSRDDIDAVMSTDLAMKIDASTTDTDPMLDEVLNLALVRDLEVGDTGSPAECFVDLALAIRELRIMALEREGAQAEEMIDTATASDSLNHEVSHVHPR